MAQGTAVGAAAGLRQAVAPSERTQRVKSGRGRVCWKIRVFQ
jgi:hypothetical protein